MDETIKQIINTETYLFTQDSETNIENSNESNYANEDIHKPKPFAALLSLLDGNEESDNENNDQENARNGDNDNLEREENQNNVKDLMECMKSITDDSIPAKRNSKTYEKDRLKLLSENQRLIRETNVIDYKHKPKQCKTVKEFREMLLQKRNKDKSSSTHEVIANEKKSPLKEMNENSIEEHISKTSDDEGEIAPLRERLQLDENTARNLDKSAAKNSSKKSTKSLNEYLLGKYLGNRLSFAEKKRLEEFSRKIKGQLTSTNSGHHSTDQDLDIVVKEHDETSGEVQFVVKHINTNRKNQPNVVKVAGEIDPILSKGLDSLLSDEDRLRYSSMSTRDKWKKHRSLLLSAENEKRKATREERLNEMKLKDEDRAVKEGRKEGDDNNGLSDDDYEWKEDDVDSGSESDSESKTESVADGAEYSDEEFQKIKKFSRNQSQKSRVKVLSDDDDDDELTDPYDENDLISDSNPMKEFINLDVDFCDIPASNVTSSDLFPDYSVCGLSNTTFADSVNNEPSMLLTNTTHSFEESLIDFNASLDSVSLSLSKSTEVLGDSQPQLDDTVVNTGQSQVQLDDTVVNMGQSHTQLDDTQLDSTLLISQSGDLDATMPYNPDSSSRSLEKGAMNSLHNNLFNFQLSNVFKSNTEDLAKKTFSTLKSLFANSQEHVELTQKETNTNTGDIEDIDDVKIDEDDDDPDRDDTDNSQEKNVDSRSNTMSSNRNRMKIVDLDEDEDDENIDLDRSDDENSENEDSSNCDGSGEEIANVEVDDEDEEEILRKEVVGKTKTVFMPKEYFDEEAELSGSDAEDYGPDEDETGLDKYEDETGEAEQLPSEGRLRRQIEKIHNRLEIDKDAQDIRYLKEIYLEDGDLHLGEGPRKKRFAWADLNDEENSDFVLANNDNDDDQVEDDAEVMEVEGHLVEKDEDEHAAPLLEKYGKILGKSQWAPKQQDDALETHQAWQVDDKIDIVGTANDTGRILPLKPVVKKHGSFLNKSVSHFAVPACPIKPVSNDVSLKNRMQQHTFSVQTKNATKRSTDGDNEEDVAKKHKLH